MAIFEYWLVFRETSRLRENFVASSMFVFVNILVFLFDVNIQGGTLSVISVCRDFRVSPNVDIHK